MFICETETISTKLTLFGYRPGLWKSSMKVIATYDKQLPPPEISWPDTDNIWINCQLIPSLQF